MDCSALIRCLPASRMLPYLAAAQDQQSVASTLYVWNRDLSVAILADIAFVEVVLRSAMHEAATAAWGSHWYESIDMDDRSAHQLATAFGNLPKNVQTHPSGQDVPGRVVAQCMFGFWTNLLDKGGYTGRPPRRREVSYDKHWAEAFKAAFPGGGVEARALRQATNAVEPTFTRDWVHGVCKVVNDLRNRVAHHESLLNGFPLKGQKDSHGQPIRLTAQEGHDECLRLARMLDRDFAAWLSTNSRVSTLLANRPTLP